MIAALHRTSRLRARGDDMIDLDTTLRRNSDILYAPSGSDSAVMMSIEAGKYFGLNAVGARIWELLAEPRRLADVCSLLQEEFDVDGPTCADAVRAFASQLVDQGIAHAVDP